MKMQRIWWLNITMCKSAPDDLWPL